MLINEKDKSLGLDFGYARIWIFNYLIVAQNENGKTNSN
jgi:hypothetical protein